jgi:Reverse transcriptase (RNA-dependent DNA polymerase)
VLLRGECPKEMRELVFGGTLIALSKKSGGLRPIVIGYAWRRLAAKCANRYALSRLESFFAPLQVGVAAPGGGEAAVHAARSFVTNMTEDQIFVKLDFANAFNTLRRDIMLQAVHDTIPEIYAFIHQAYSAESQLQFGSFVVRSRMGPQQGDPLGPLLFCLPLQPVLRSMRSGFRLGYLDDLSLGGKKEDVRQDLTLVRDLETSLGVCLNRHKCELYSRTEPDEAEFQGFLRVDLGSLLLLGAPLFRGEALDGALLGHSEALERAVRDLACLPAQAALILLRASFGAAKLTYLLRAAPCYRHPLLERMDDQMRSGLENILNVHLSDIQWLQASLPIRDGGLGVRRVSMLATSAYLASAASTKSLVSAILSKEEWGDAHLDELLEARKNTLPSSVEPPWIKQKMWDGPLIEADRTTVWAAYNDPVSRARLGAVTSPHAGDWLSTIPVTACGLVLTNEAVRVAVGLRLGLDLCAPHECQCGEMTDTRGHHGLVCRRSTGRAARHFALNDLVWRALARADIPSSKEPPGLIRTDGKRPDGATLVPWARGKYIAWDVTAIHTCAASYIHLSSNLPGGAAEHAADRKCTKYVSLPATHEFVPIAIESLGPVNRAGREFMLELGRRAAAVSGDPRETIFLFQRVSILTQRFNAVAFRGTFAPHPGDEDQA